MNTDGNKDIGTWSINYKVFGSLAAANVCVEAIRSYMKLHKVSGANRQNVLYNVS